MINCIHFLSNCEWNHVALCTVLYSVRINSLYPWYSDLTVKVKIECKMTIHCFNDNSFSSINMSFGSKKMQILQTALRFSPRTGIFLIFLKWFPWWHYYIWYCWFVCHCQWWCYCYCSSAQDFHTLNTVLFFLFPWLYISALILTLLWTSSIITILSCGLKYYIAKIIKNYYMFSLDRQECSYQVPGS